MKKILSILTCSLLSLTLSAHKPFSIQPVGYTVQSETNQNHYSPVDHMGGSFRLKEIDPLTTKEIETDLVTWFIAKNQPTSITLHINCAKPINLHYVLTDNQGEHVLKVNESGSYQRIKKELDLDDFNPGICTLTIYNDQHKIIHQIVFEKVTL